MLSCRPAKRFSSLSFMWALFPPKALTRWETGPFYSPATQDSVISQNRVKGFLKKLTISNWISNTISYCICQAKKTKKLKTSIIGISMPRKSKLKLPPLNLGKETIGQRLARLRKERGYTQEELADKMGLIQALISAYELDKLRLHAEMVVRFAKALNVSADSILCIKPEQNDNNKPSLKIIRRLKRIETIPPSQQKLLLKTIDTFLKAAEKF